MLASTCLIPERPGLGLQAVGLKLLSVPNSDVASCGGMPRCVAASLMSDAKVGRRHRLRGDGLNWCKPPHPMRQPAEPFGVVRPADTGGHQFRRHLPALLGGVRNLLIPLRASYPPSNACASRLTPCHGD